MPDSEDGLSNFRTTKWQTSYSLRVHHLSTTYGNISTIG